MMLSSSIAKLKTLVRSNGTTMLERSMSRLPPVKDGLRVGAGKVRGWMGLYPRPMLFVVLPLVVTALYLFFFAASRWESESKITVKQSMESTSNAFALGTMFSNQQTYADSYYLREYILSFDMLDHLDRSLNLKEAYGSPWLDVVYRYWPFFSREGFLDYYQNRVQVEFDEATSIMSIRTQGFTAEFAKRLNEEILRQSETYINDLTHKVALEQVHFMEQQLREALDRMNAARAQVLAFQKKYRVLDPVQQAQGTTGYLNSMEANLANQEATLKNLRSYLNSDTYQVKSVENQVNALRHQLKEERTRISGGGATPLNELAAKFSDLRIQAEFEDQVYKSALVALEASRVESLKKIKNLIILTAPTLPETAKHPQQFVILGTLALLLGALYGIIELSIATIKDHRD